MERNRVLGMVCGYFLSRFDEEAYASLGFGTRQATHQALGMALSVPAASIKNWRDEFDPVHENNRQGWHKREMCPSRRRTIEALGDLTYGELLALVRSITASPSGQSACEVFTAISNTDGVDDGGPGSFGLRGPTGIKAEQAFMRYHEKNRQPLAGDLVDRRHEQCGFDFEIIGKPGQAFVEVKGLAGSTGGITFTNKEWITARERGDEYYLALVRNVATEPEIALFCDPISRFDAQMRTYTTVQVGWSVAQRELRAAEGEPAG